MMMVMLVLMMFFISMIQPIFMMGTMILIVFLYSYIMYSMMKSYWFSYALIMVMLSGVLVLFTYMITLIPNESFESFYFLFLFLLMFMLLGEYKFLYFYNMNYLCINLWINYVSIMNLFMVSFLLGIMLMVVYMGYMNMGAVRIN